MIKSLPPRSHSTSGPPLTRMIPMTPERRFVFVSNAWENNSQAVKRDWASRSVTRNISRRTPCAVRSGTRRVPAALKCDGNCYVRPNSNCAVQLAGVAAATRKAVSVLYHLVPGTGDVDLENSAAFVRFARGMRFRSWTAPAIHPLPVPTVRQTLGFLEECFRRDALQHVKELDYVTEIRFTILVARPGGFRRVGRNRGRPAGGGPRRAAGKGDAQGGSRHFPGKADARH